MFKLGYNTEASSYLLTIGGIVLSLIGVSSLFAVGYINDIPREAFLVFGRDLSLAVGLNAGFAAAFSLITAKTMLILFSVMTTLTGGIFSGSKNKTLKRMSEKADAAAIRIATAPIKVVLLLSAWIFWGKFLQFSTSGLIAAGGWVLIGGILLETSDRVLFRKLTAAADEKANAEISSYFSVRATLLATLISVFAYFSGLVAERQIKQQEPRRVSEKLDQAGVVFGASDIGLLVFLPGELIETRAGGLLEKRKPSSWYLIPFDGAPIELR